MPHIGQPKRSAKLVDITSFSKVGKRNEAVMQKYIANEAPLSICVDASSWQTYKRGVIGQSCNTNVLRPMPTTCYGFGKLYRDSLIGMLLQHVGRHCERHPFEAIDHVHADVDTCACCACRPCHVRQAARSLCAAHRVSKSHIATSQPFFKNGAKI